MNLTLEGSTTTDCIMRSLLCIIFAICISILVGCNLYETDLSLPEVGIPNNKLNEELYLTAPNGWNTFKTSDMIAVEVTVKSNNTIVFQPDFGARIFLLDDNNWVELEDNAHHPHGPIYLSSKSGFGDLNVVLLQPNPLDSSKQVKLRIYIIGNVFLDGQITDELVGSYVDINLTP